MKWSENCAARKKHLSRVIYPNIAKYLSDNRLTVPELANICGISETCLYQLLNGRHGATKDTIDHILCGTGMTYEEAFREGN